MKNLYFLCFSVFIILSFSGCCSDCPDNLTEYYNNLPYKNDDTVHFINDIKGELIYTVYIYYTPVDSKSCSSGDNKKYDCVGNIYMSIGHYRECIDQDFDGRNNRIIFKATFYNKQLNNTCLVYNDFYLLMDTINYNYGDKNIIAHNYVLQTTIDDSSEYCSSYIVSSDHKLLEYTMFENNVKYVWRLK